MLITSTIFGVDHAAAEEPDSTEIIIDNTDEGFSKEGNWNTSTYRSGYYGEDYFSAAGSMGGSGAAATWTPDIETAGYYNIYVQHPQGGNDSSVADNVPYKITHADGDTVIRKSQRNSGGNWEFLACERFTQGSAGSVTLTLDDEAGGAVMADAVRFVLVMAESEVETIIVDNNEAEFIDSKWAKSTYREGYYGDDYQSIAQDTAEDYTTAAATWTPEIKNSGYYNVYVQHPEGGGDSSISDNVPYKIKHALGENVVRLNQREKGQGGKWRKLGTFRFESGREGYIQISFDGVDSRKAIMADAVRLERISDISVDDGSFVQTGAAWEHVENQGASGGSYSVTQNGDSGSRLSYKFYVTTGGGYRLRFYKPAGLDVSGMSREMTVQIDNQSYTVDLTSLQDGYNTVAFCALEEGAEHTIEFLRSQDASVFLDAVSLEYVGYSLYYTEFSDESADRWILDEGWSISDNTLTGNQGSAFLSGEGWKNIRADFTFTTDMNGDFGLITGGSEEEGWSRLEYDSAEKVFLLLGPDGTELGRSGSCVLESGRTYTLQILSETPHLTVSLDGEQLIRVEGERSGNLGVYAAGALLAVSGVGVDEAEGALEGNYTVRLDDPQQTIWGLGVEIQSDSIASGNQGLPEDNHSVPHDLTQSERDRLYSEMLKGFRYMRMAGGLFYRGTDEEGKHLQERWDTQNEELAELIEKSGMEGINFEFWSPTPYFKANDGYRENPKYGLKCFDPDFTGDKDAFLQEFADTIVEDLRYLKENGMPVVQFSLQNEPEWRHDTGYSHCYYDADMYYETVQKVFPALKEAFPDILIHADSLSGQYSARSKKIINDPELLQYVDAWTHHYMGSDSNVQIDSAEYLTSNKGRDDIPVYNTEFEYLDGNTSDWRCINTAQSIMNWMTFENSPTWYWLHALKPLGNSEAEGYSLGFWRKPGDTAQYSEKYNHIEEGEWDYNYQNWNAIRGFLKYMPWDSVRYTVDEDEVRYDQRIMSWKTPEGKLVIALTNRSSDDYFQFHLNTGLEASFQGYRYTPQGEEEIELGTMQGSEISPMLPPLSIEFWVQEEDETMVMADSVVMDQSELDLAVGNETQLTANVLPENAANKNVRWTSEDSTVASVDENGIVTGLKEGETKIIATAISGSGQFKAECIVKVGKTEPEEPSEPVSKTNLEYFLNKAKGFVEDGTVSGLVESIQQMFTDAIAKGEAVMADENATREEVLDAAKDLMLAIHALDMKAADKTDLEMALDLAEMIDLSKYVEAGQAEFLEAKEAAEEVLAYGDAMQAETDEAWNSLVEAMNALRLKADKSVLQDLISQTAELDLSGYTKESANVFRAALAAADSILADETLSADEQAKVDEAATALQEAYDGLETASQNSGDTENRDPENTDGNSGQSGDETSGKDDGKTEESSGQKDTKDSEREKMQRTPKTGDNAWEMMVYAAALALGMLAAAFVLEKRKRS